MSEEKGLTLHYFDAKARAFGALLGGAYFGKDINWEKYSLSDWQANKNDIKSKAPFGQLPILVDGDIVLGQSNAIIRYCGKKWGIEGESMDDYAMSEVLIEEAEDLYSLVANCRYVHGDTVEAWNEAYSKLPKHFENLEKLMTGQLFASTLLMGDMAIFAVINIILDSWPNLLGPKLRVWYDEIANTPAVKTLLKESTVYLTKPAGCGIEVGYWHIRGLAAPLRMICEYAGADYTSTQFKVIKGDDGNWDLSCWFGEAKPKILKKNPMANLPYIVDGNVTITQSNACMAYLGRKFGLYGKNISENVKVEQCLAQILDLRNDMVHVFYSAACADEAGQHKLIWTADKHLQKMENWLKHNKTAYCASDSPTVADFHFWELIDQMEMFASRYKKLSPLKGKVKLEQLYSNMRNLKELASYFEGDLYKLPVNNVMSHFQ